MGRKFGIANGLPCGYIRRTIKHEVSTLDSVYLSKIIFIHYNGQKKSIETRDMKYRKNKKDIYS